MADVRCPMCSKPNPDNAQACQHCGARLRPLTAPSGSDAPSPSAPPSEGTQDSSDWLGNFRSDGGDTYGADSEESFDAGEGGDDWLSRLGQGDEAPPAGASKPDWLATPSERGDPNVPDWMEELGVSADAQQTGGDSWGQFSQADEPADSKPDADELKSWLSGLSEGDASANSVEAASNSSSDLPDWLSDLGGDIQPAAEETSLSPVEQPAQLEEPLPDWLSAVGGDDSTASGAEADAEPGAEAAELPNWLTAPGGLPEPVVQDSPAASSDESGLPTWLSDIESPDLSDAAQQPEEAGQAETLPSWLSGAVEDEALSQGFATESVPEGDVSAQETPDWLSQFGEAPGADEEFSQQASPLSAAGPAGKAPKPFPTGSLSTGEFGVDDTPDWLSNLGSLEQVTSEASEGAADISSDWLSGLGDLSIEELTQEAVQEPAQETQGQDESAAFAMSDLDSTPDWLSNVTAPEAVPEEAAPVEAAGEGDEDVAPAELPTWLEAMRPLESAAPTAAFRDEGDTRVESAGPLSGLRGVLQAEPDIANFRKPPTYLNKLQVTEAHQAHIALLEELVAAEGKPIPVQPFVRIRSQLVLRLAIALSLVVAVFVGLLWDSNQIVPLPWGGDGEELPQEIRNMRGSIEALSPNAPVLVAIDYDAGSSAEVSYPARVVLQNLEQRNAFIGFVSTSLSGPMLTKLLLSEVDASTTMTYTNYTVLGYIPGGESGLSTFARAPRQTVDSFDNRELPIVGMVSGALDGSGWESAPLSQVNLLPDFDLVIVMTDNADTARIWIEQVRPALDADTPLLMVLSAQAEPMVRPYFQPAADTLSQMQVSGYVAGMAGAAAYQNKFTPGKTLKEWDALAMASFVAIVALVLGGLVNLGLAVSSRPKAKK